MIPRNLTTYAKSGVTGVTGVTRERSAAQQGFARNTSEGQPSHRHTGDVSGQGESVTPASDSKIGVTKTCDAESRASIDSSDSVTPVTPVTPKKEYVAVPWGPSLSADDVRRMRAELVGMIETLADMENWDEGRRDDVLTRAIRGPLADLLPNLAHFNERLAAARADAEARRIADARAYRVTDDVLRRRGYRV